MKDSKQIRKVLFIGKSNVALIIMNSVDGSNNLLFASQLNVDKDNTPARITELLTNAANFLGFNIKDVDMVFDDDQMTRFTLTEEQFIDCTCEQDIAKEIFKKAKIDNYFVNEINFFGIKYDEIEKTAKVNCQVCATSYYNYRHYLNIVRACNISVNKSINLYKLLKRNKDQIELSIKIDNDVAVACEYYGNKLNNAKTINLNVDEIKQHIHDRFNISIDKINGLLAVANELVASGETDVAVANNYDLKTKSFNNVKALDIIALYRDEIKTQINNFVDYRNFQNVQVISDQPINYIDGFDCAENDNIGFENISLDKIVSIANIDVSQETDQYAFENKKNVVDALA